MGLLQLNGLGSITVPAVPPPRVSSDVTTRLRGFNVSVRVALPNSQLLCRLCKWGDALEWRVLEWARAVTRCRYWRWPVDVLPFGLKSAERAGCERPHITFLGCPKGCGRDFKSVEKDQPGRCGEHGRARRKVRGKLAKIGDRLTGQQTIPLDDGAWHSDRTQRLIHSRAGACPPEPI